MDTNQIQQARKLREEGQSLRQIAASLGVAPATVSRVLKNPTTVESSTLEKLRQERLKKLRHQNSKLALEVRRLKAEVVDGEKMKREVLACNSVVKLQILSAPIRVGPALGLTSEQIEGLNQALVDACNDLAFNKERPLETCPTCGGRMKENPQ